MLRRVHTLILAVLTLVLCLTQAASAVVYVKKGTATQDGNSWETAYHSIQAGVNDAFATGEDVWVAQGTYVENITMKNGVSIYGGYLGSGTTSDIALYETIVDGSGSTVVTGANSAAIDGFTIRNGSTGVNITSKSGAVVTRNKVQGNATGIFLMYCTSPTLTDNTFTSNTGYAVEVYTSLSGQFSPTGNTATGNGVNGIVFNNATVDGQA
jgi:parallel beta-helix repeat protein